MSFFNKVSFGQYLDANRETNPLFNATDAQKEYEDLKLPKRATAGSAGYDLFAPYDFTIRPNEYVKVPLGISWVTKDNSKQFLMIVPRSGLGFKYGVRLANTTGIIDSDYCNSDNEGHIFAKVTADKTVEIKKGTAFLQGIIVPYGTTSDDEAIGERNGGFGSTDGKK